MPAGRPSKLTPELQRQICDLLRAGNYVETVCDYVGIEYKTYYNWRNRGERAWQVDIEAGYVEFLHAVKKAVSEVEILTIADLRSGPMNWQAKAWWLERRHPDRWGNRQKMEHTTPKDSPFTIEVNHVNYKEGLVSSGFTSAED